MQTSVLHLIVTPDGEDVDCEPILGYLHKGMGKITENQTIIQYLPYVTRWEAATGMGMMHNYFHIRGVVTDLPYGWIDKFEGIGVIGGEEEINWSLSSPILQASRIKWDFQKALERISGGPYENLEIRCFDRERDLEYRFIKLNARMEALKGELGIFLIRDQSDFPWRWKIRPSSFIILQIIPHLLKIMKLVDIMTILGVLVIVWLEREISTTGHWGILQVLADGTKLLFKENICNTPKITTVRKGNTCLFSIGPAILLKAGSKNQSYRVFIILCIDSIHVLLKKQGIE
ncbi:hypothetical protein ES288_D08G124100v1 [Gossypium darwinii]|uniref:NADH-quinone oxidoreductase subunit D domain-containing protein n=1 Tax=Gossypium darwinii TaxID=34276 RepID=A0A5D2BM83_GOSDA|nr:hypothetical protein ES288_D08G124100v1 [Gossypium darwinii]